MTGRNHGAAFIVEALINSRFVDLRDVVDNRDLRLEPVQTFFIGKVYKNTTRNLHHFNLRYLLSIRNSSNIRNVVIFKS